MMKGIKKVKVHVCSETPAPVGEVELVGPPKVSVAVVVVAL